MQVRATEGDIRFHGRYCNRTDPCIRPRAPTGGHGRGHRGWCNAARAALAMAGSPADSPQWTAVAGATGRLSRPPARLARLRQRIFPCHHGRHGLVLPGARADDADEAVCMVQGDRGSPTPAAGRVGDAETVSLGRLAQAHRRPGRRAQLDGAAGDGRINFIDTRDMAAVAHLALLGEVRADREHRPPGLTVNRPSLSGKEPSWIA